MNSQQKLSRRYALLRGFTLIELLVVISIISVLIAMLMPAITAAQESAKNVNCMSNLRQLGIATNTFAEEHDGQIPDFFFNFVAGNSTNIIVLIVPKHAATSGFDYYLDDITLCPSDAAPGPVQVLQPDGQIKLQPVSYGVNADMDLREINSHRLTQPSSIAFFFDGYMTGSGEDPFHMQGQYKGSMEVVAKMLRTRHNKLANCLFMDGHVEPITELTPEMIAQNGQPYEAHPGKGGNGGGNGGGHGGGNGNPH